VLEQVLVETHNWFIHDVLNGVFTLTEDVPPSFAEDGQYFRIVGSVFNDGLHLKTDTFKPETFQGTVYRLAIPQAVIALANEIEAWTAANAETITSPYQSESFGGYSYSKASGFGWQEHFKAQLDAWRKLP
jgi:hypothetical protein